MNYDYPMLKLAYDADGGAALDCDAGAYAGILAQAVAGAPAPTSIAAPTTANGAVDAAASARHDVLMEFFEIMEQSPHKPASELISDILRKSRELTCAEAGSIFILRSDGAKRWLEAASVQNDVIRLEPADFTIALDTASIAGYVAATGETLVIDDLYAIPAGRPYSFNVGFDEASGYRSRSMMCFPLNNYDGDVIGVVQLINRRGAACVEALPFTAEEKALILPVKQVLGSAIERALMHEHIIDANAELLSRNDELREQRKQIVMLQGETEEAFMLSINMLAVGAEIHDADTASHIARTNHYSYFVAGKLGMSDDFCDEISYSAQLHDVGKMSINTSVLKKNGPLGPDERDEMNLHPVYGHQILAHTDRLKMAADIAHAHHEKWDGTGYPNGLAGEQIPVAARIVALADIYDALRSKRCYKPAFDHEKARHIILNGDERLDPAGHFDPALLKIFAENHGDMAAIWERCVG